MPCLVISDNGKTFKGSSLKPFLSQHGIMWKSLVPLGGVGSSNGWCAHPQKCMSDL